MTNTREINKEFPPLEGVELMMAEEMLLAQAEALLGFQIEKPEYERQGGLLRWKRGEKTLTCQYLPGRPLLLTYINWREEDKWYYAWEKEHILPEEKVRYFSFFAAEDRRTDVLLALRNRIEYLCNPRYLGGVGRPLYLWRNGRQGVECYVYTSGESHFVYREDGREIWSEEMSVDDILYGSLPERLQETLSIFYL